jgi:hypothetical protein
MIFSIIINQGKTLQIYQQRKSNEINTQSEN